MAKKSKKHKNYIRRNKNQSWINEEGNLLKNVYRCECGKYTTLRNLHRKCERCKERVMYRKVNTYG